MNFGRKKKKKKTKDEGFTGIDGNPSICGKFQKVLFSLNLPQATMSSQPQGKDGKKNLNAQGSGKK